jgi:hypothetical protein
VNPRKISQRDYWRTENGVKDSLGSCRSSAMKLPPEVPSIEVSKLKSTERIEHSCPVIVGAEINGCVSPKNQAWRLA